MRMLFAAPFAKDAKAECTYRELSSGARRFLAAMLPGKRESSLADVARRMGVGSNYASQYKRRLLDQGVVGEPSRGWVRFGMPALREYLEERLEEAPRVK